MNVTEVSAARESDEAGRVGRTAPILAIVRTGQGRLGVALIILILGVLIVGPHVAPYNPTQVAIGPTAAPPSAHHWLGTDELGRDVWSRFLTGGASVITIPLAAVSLAFLVGGTTGLVFGYIGGKGDVIVARLIDVLLPIPTLLVAILLIAQLGGSFWTLVLTVGFVFTPRVARVVRGATQNQRLADYVLAAEARGDSRRAIIFREMLPNLIGPLVVEFGVRVNYAVVFVASLNFLGLAAQPPSSNWGLMIADGQNLIGSNPAAALVPAVALGAIVVGINLLSDSGAQYFSYELEAR